jgi:nitrogen fixation protein
VRDRIVLCLAALCVAFRLSATTYTVTTTADSGAGSLRQAITDANGNAGADTIHFNIVGGGVHTIVLATPLPAITDAVTINGYSQPGASANTNAPNQGTNAVLRIEIDGTAIGFSGSGLVSQAAGVTIRGLAINRCPNGGIQVNAGGSGTLIAGNFLGPDPAGAVRAGAQYVGVEIETSGVIVGGANPADRNLISGNDSAQVLVGDVGGANSVIQGNLIGTNAAGTAAIQGLFNYALVYIRNGLNIQIGGPTAAERNVISGGSQAGVAAGIGVGYTIGGTNASATIEGNFIGTDVTGTLPLGNNIGISLPDQNCTIRGNVIADSLSQGISSESGHNAIIVGNFIGTDVTASLHLGNHKGGIVVGGDNWQIGGPNPGDENVIAHNGDQSPSVGGIVNSGNQMARIRRNRIFDNASLGIDLYSSFAAGVTPNDAGDGDTGPNGLQNYPILTSAGPALGEGAGTHIVGVLNSAASTTYDLDFFSNPACASRPQEYLEGQDYLGSTQVTTDGSGNATIDITLPATVQNGSRITATATDPSGNTSEFSQRIIFSVTPTSGPPEGGTNFTLTGMLFASGITVTVGGQSATNIFVVNPTTITATSPALPAGSLNNIVVSNTDLTGGTLVNGWVADFSDVPTAQQFHFYIAKLVANAITVGCGTGIYCPLSSVTRQQMAVFLLKSKNGLCYVPPPCSGDFPDVPCSSNFAPWIEALADAGITTGCGGGNFCPTNPVTRQQMAVFLLKTKHGSTYIPPNCSGDFLDVPCPSQFANWIEQLAAESITSGCGGGNYCPTDAVRRDQMAAFLYNTFQFP